MVVVFVVLFMLLAFITYNPFSGALIAAIIAGFFAAICLSDSWWRGGDRSEFWMNHAFYFAIGFFPVFVVVYVAHRVLS